MRNITVEDLRNIDYYQVPKWLMDMFLAGKITTGGFKTYVLMYDRLRVSAKNNWFDDEGVVYIKYSYNELLEDLQSNSKTTVSNNIKELERLNLISKVKCFSASNIYYLTIYSTENCTSTEDCTSTKKCTSISTENCTDSSIEKCTSSSTENLYPSKNNSSKNNKSKNNYSKNNICEELEKENISDELKDKLLEFIDYRKEIKKPIKTYKAIKSLLNKIGTDFINEQHLIISIENTFANQYQGVFPAELKRQVNQVKESYASRRLREIKEARE